MSKIWVGIGLFFTSTNTWAAIINGSFESPSLNPGVKSTTGAPSWTILDDAGLSGGAWNYVVGVDFVSAPPHGSQCGYGALVLQQVSDVVAIGTQSFQFETAESLTSGNPGAYFAQIWAGGLISNFQVAGGTLIASTLISALPTGWSSQSVAYTAAAGDPFLGQQMTFRIEAINHGDVYLDDVRLIPVPEPGSVMALVGGCLMLVLRRRVR